MRPCPPRRAAPAGAAASRQAAGGSDGRDAPPRRVAGLLAAAAALAAACGCRTAPDALTLVVAVLPGELPVYRSVVAEFERESGRRVVVVPQQYADIRRALRAATLGGRGTLDVVELDVHALALAADDVTELAPEILAAELAAFVPGTVPGDGRGGLRFVPHRLAWQALVYDHAVLGRPPGTWDELLAVARAHPGRIGIKGALYEGLTCDVLPFVWAAGGTGERFDEPAALAALRFLAALAPYLAPHSATYREATVAAAMSRGELVLHLNWPFVMSLYAAQGLAPGRVRSAPLPAAPGGGRATVLGGGYLAVARGAPHRADAVRLVRHLVSRPAQARFARELGWFPARADVPVEDPRGLLGGFVAMRDAVRTRPARADYPRRSRAWQEAARAVLFAGADPAAALAAAAREAGDAP